VFNFTDEFNAHVVEPYVDAHRNGKTPNPCVECNRHLKFDAFLERALRLGFDAIATGHHARVIRPTESGRVELRRGADRSKDQSYVLSVLGSAQLERIVLPIGHLQKTEVRTVAQSLRLTTAAKPDSQDVCFIASRTKGAGRSGFLSERIDLHPAVVLDGIDRRPVGTVPAVELVTIGQRRGLGIATGPEPRYVIDVDLERREVVLGDGRALLVERLALADRTWVDGPVADGTPVDIQVSAHGAPRPGFVTAGGVSFAVASPRVAPGQIVACYIGDRVIGSGVVDR
jgi:tRNA-specific 2-thiouridylase